MFRILYNNSLAEKPIEIQGMPIDCLSRVHFPKDRDDNYLACLGSEFYKEGHNHFFTRFLKSNYKIFYTL